MERSGDLRRVLTGLPLTLGYAAVLIALAIGGTWQSRH